VRITLREQLLIRGATQYMQASKLKKKYILAGGGFAQVPGRENFSPLCIENHLLTYFLSSELMKIIYRYNYYLFYLPRAFNVNFYQLSFESSPARLQNKC